LYRVPDVDADAAREYDRDKESRFMSDLDRLSVWNDSAVRGALSWYLDVAENRRPAKFRIAATVATQLDPATSSEDALWVELKRLTPIFVTRWQATRAGAPLRQAADGPSLLELCRELAYRMLAHCNFCPWNCRVDRMAGTKFGACKLASGSRVSSHFHHTGEELCRSDSRKDSKKPHRRTPTKGDQCHAWLLRGLSVPRE
jgi:putative pyruvate formate lyase activating enzyme